MVLFSTSSPTWMQPGKFAEEGYIRNAVAYACVSKIATAAASVKLGVYRTVGEKREIVKKSPLMDLLNRPNPSTGGAAFMRALISFYNIEGAAYIVRLPYNSNGKPAELWLLRPDKVQPVIEKSTGKLIGWEYGGTGGVVFPVDMLSGQSDVLQIKNFNPRDDYRGLSTMQPAATSIDIVTQALSWNMALLSNGARPSGAYVVKQGEGTQGKLTEDQFQRLREQIRTDAGASAAGKPMLLEGGLDWKEMSLSPKDMDFDKGLWAAARMVATAYGVPPQLVNIPGESTYSNMTEAKLSLWQETVLPLLDLVIDELNNWLTPLYGDDQKIEYDENSIPALANARIDKMEKLEKVTYLTADEKRELVSFPNYEPSGKAAGTLYATSGQVPLEMLSDEDFVAPKPAAEEDDDVADPKKPASAPKKPGARDEDSQR